MRRRNRKNEKDGCIEITALSREKKEVLLWLFSVLCVLRPMVIVHCSSSTTTTITVNADEAAQVNACGWIRCVHIISFKIYCITVSFCFVSVFYCLAVPSFERSSHQVWYIYIQVCWSRATTFPSNKFMSFGRVSAFLPFASPKHTVMCNKFMKWFVVFWFIFGGCFHRSFRFRVNFFLYFVGKEKKKDIKNLVTDFRWVKDNKCILS